MAPDDAAVATTRGGGTAGAWITLALLGATAVAVPVARNWDAGGGANRAPLVSVAVPGAIDADSPVERMLAEMRNNGRAMTGGAAGGLADASDASTAAARDALTTVGEGATGFTSAAANDAQAVETGAVAALASAEAAFATRERGTDGEAGEASDDVGAVAALDAAEAAFSGRDRGADGENVGEVSGGGAVAATEAAEAAFTRRERGTEATGDAAANIVSPGSDTEDGVDRASDKRPEGDLAEAAFGVQLTVLERSRVSAAGDPLGDGEASSETTVRSADGIETAALAPPDGAVAAGAIEPVIAAGSAATDSEEAGGGSAFPMPRRKPDDLGVRIAMLNGDAGLAEIQRISTELLQELPETVTPVASGDDPAGQMPAVLPRRSPIAAPGETLEVAAAVVGPGPGAALLPSGTARIALVLTSLGFDEAVTRQAIQAFPAPVALSFAPVGLFTGALAPEAAADGHAVLAEIPMEPENPARDPQVPMTLRVSNAASENIRRLDDALAAVPSHIGVSTYLGARFSRSAEAAAPVVGRLAERNLLLFENQPINGSRLAELARANGVRYLSSGVWLDRETGDGGIRARLAELEAASRTDGRPRIAIAPGYPEIIAILTDWASTRASRGVEIVPLTGL